MKYFQQEVYICSILPKIHFRSYSTVNKMRPILYIFFTQKSLETSRIAKVKIKLKKKESDSMQTLLLIQVWRLGHQFLNLYLILCFSGTKLEIVSNLYQIFKKVILTGSHFLEGGCWEIVGDIFQGRD